MIADARLEQSIRWRAAYRYRLERLFFNEKSIIARSASVAARGCVPDSASAAGVDIVYRSGTESSLTSRRRGLDSNF